jgi:hypothetical protein
VLASALSFTVACSGITAPIQSPNSIDAPTDFRMAPSRVDYDITCTTDIQARQTTCDSPTATAIPRRGAAFDLILTQGPYFTLVKGAASCAGAVTRICTESNAVQNLMAQPVGVNAVGVVSGIKVVFKAISAAKGNGTLVDISVTSDGIGTFTFPDNTTLNCTKSNISGVVVSLPCDFYLYNEAVNPSATSSSKMWKFTMSSSATSYTYTVNVSAPLPEESAALRWVNDQQDLTSSDGLFGVHGTSNSNVFAVGSSGLIQHYNGTTWSTQTSGTSVRLNSVWAASPTEAFVAGFQNTLLHWNGSAWSPMTIGGTPGGLPTTWYGVFGFSSTDVYAVGAFGQIRHWDGSTWTSVTSPVSYILTSIWGASPNAMFATGTNGTLLQWDGTTWTDITYRLPGVLRQSSYNLYNVWGTSGGSVIYVAGRNGLLFRSTDSGATFTSLTSSLPAGYGAFVWGLWGTSANDVYLSTAGGNVMHWDGVKWWTHTSGQTSQLSGMWGTSTTNMFVVGQNKTIVRGLN